MMRRAIYLLLLTTPFLQGCASESSEPTPLHFFVLGDWGERGSTEQMQVSQQMNEWANQIPPKFILTTGDNFYSIGVASTTDSHWAESYEQVYDGNRISLVPWFPTLGNHDYMGSPSAQVQYSQINPRWQMLDRYYTTLMPTPQGSRIRLVMMDTSPLHDFYHTYAPMMTEIAAQDTTRQLHWLDSVTSLNDADWKIVVGHHPVYTGGFYKNDVGSVRGHLEPIFERNGVDIYFCGHEHDLQHLKPTDRRTHYFISGGGSKIRTNGTIPETLFSESTFGFMIVSIDYRDVHIRVINEQGVEIYRVKLTQ